MKIFIIYDLEKGFLESIWSTKGLARAAITFHSKQTGTKKRDYDIIEREINQLADKKNK